MKYVDEFRDPVAAKNLQRKIKELCTKQWSIMEICGGQTHSILKNGIHELLPEEINLIHGPGCPVCVTPVEMIDKAVEIAGREDVIFTSFGDMLRVPGSQKDLLSVKSEGGDVRMVYSPLDAVKIAANNPEKKVVFFAIGFETTAPANAMAVLEAERKGLQNFSILCSQVLVPPAIKALMNSKDVNIQGFLAAGHVCTVMGYWEYVPLAEEFRIPIVVTGFEPVDILEGVYRCVKQLEEGTYFVENQYSRVVTKEGNKAAQALLQKVFRKTDMKWRGMGVIPESGLKLKEEYSDFDAEMVFSTDDIFADEPEICIVGEILKGVKKPIECPAFQKECTPEHPLGAAMVSSEGACSAYFHYFRN